MLEKFPQARVILAFLRSDLFLAYLGAMPLFFSWLPLVTWKYEDPRLRSIGLYSCVLTVCFFGGIGVAVASSWIPGIGGYLANVFHTLGILFYLGLSGFLVYLVRYEKNIEIPIVSKWKHSLEVFLDGMAENQAPIAQLDRASDYGSEG